MSKKSSIVLLLKNNQIAAAGYIDTDEEQMIEKQLLKNVTVVGKSITPCG